MLKLGGFIILKTIKQSNCTRKEAENILHEYRIAQEKRKMIALSNHSEKRLLENDSESLFTKQVSNALSILPIEQRSLLVKRYLENNGRTFDYIVKGKLGVSERTYYRIKAEALSYFYELYTISQSDQDSWQTHGR